MINPLLKNFFRRAISTLFLWAVVLIVILTHWEPGFVIIVASVGGLALWEFFTALEHKGIRSLKKTAIASGVLFLIGSWIILSGKVPRLPQPMFELVCFLIFFLGILARQVFDRSQTTPVVTVAVTIFGLLYIAWLFNFVTCLIYFPKDRTQGYFLLLYLLVVTKITDIGAYLTGTWLGRHKLIPSVSPKKTWEGFIGGLFFAIGSSYSLVYLLKERLSLIPLVWAVTLGFVISIVSVVGDLAESVVKRDVQVKDSGSWIPGIGGALDLIDSILFTAPVLYLYLRLRALGIL